MVGRRRETIPLPCSCCQVICKFFTKPKHQFYIISDTYVDYLYNIFHITVYLSTHKCTLNIFSLLLSFSLPSFLFFFFSLFLSTPSLALY